jgi:hypothetical protein
MSSNQQSHWWITSFLKAAAVISFAADCVAIYLFIREILSVQNVQVSALPSQRIVTIGTVAVLAFIFALALVRFSGGRERLDSLFIIFGLVYSILAALFIHSAMSRMGLEATTKRLEEVAIYCGIAVIISAFAYIMVRGSVLGKQIAAIPYVLHGILSIVSIVVTIMQDNNPIPFVLVFLVLELMIISIFLQDTIRRRSQDY